MPVEVTAMKNTPSKRILADRGLVAPLVVERGHPACDRAVLAHAFHNASPRGPELAGIGHPPLAGGGPDPLARRSANFGNVMRAQ